MKHTKVIQPTGSSELPTNTLPDRSNLSKLYVSSQGNRFAQEKSVADLGAEGDSTTSGVTIDPILVTFLLTVPLMSTYLAAVYIYRGADMNIESPDPLFPLLSFFASALWLLSCVVSLRILARRFYAYDASLGIFIIAYLFFVLPIVKLTYNLFPVNFIGIISTIIAWLIANYLIVLYITWSFNKSSNKIVAFSVPVLILILCAVLW